MKKLYVIATPIGNLSDVSERCKNTLKKVSLLFCEDTRRASSLLAKVEASPKTLSFHRHNVKDVLSKLEEIVGNHEELGLITDAGTPNVSDPGWELVERALDLGWKVCPVPGPSAVSTLLSVTPHPASEFLFLGFLPDNKRRFARAVALIEITNLPTVLFVSPHDSKKLGALHSALGERRVFVGREMTKLHEEYYLTTLSEFAEKPFRGEASVVILPEKTENYARIVKELLSAPIREALRSITGTDFRTINRVLDEER